MGGEAGKRGSNFHGFMAAFLHWNHSCRCVLGLTMNMNQEQNFGFVGFPQFKCLSIKDNELLWQRLT